MQSFKVVEAVGKHTGTVIFLHGLGDQGTSFIPFARLIQSSHPHLKFILPTAKTIPITLNSGYPMPGWFDVTSLDRPNPQTDDEAGMLRSVSDIESLITNEITSSKIPEDRILVGGFSQGCVISILLGLRTERKLAGIASLSGWVPLSHKVAEMTSPGAKNLAVFWGHGKEDAVVKYQFGKASIELLQSLPQVNLPLLPKGTTFAKPGLRFESYEGLGHSFHDKEIKDFSGWLAEAIPQ